MNQSQSNSLPTGWVLATFGEITAEAVDQGGPGSQRSFVYIDISSVDNKLKRISEPKTVLTERAPTRARQRVQRGDVLVSMTRPNLNAVALVGFEFPDAVASTGFHGFGR